MFQIVVLVTTAVYTFYNSLHCGLDKNLSKLCLSLVFANVQYMQIKLPAYILLLCFAVVKRLLKRDGNNKRIYQSDGHVIYKNMTGIITESAFVLLFD